MKDNEEIKSRVEIEEKINHFRSMLSHPLCSRDYDGFLLTNIQALEWCLNDVVSKEMY